MMGKQLFIHFVEMILAVLYVIMNWPFYEGEDYLLGLLLCLGYLMTIAMYSGVCFLILAMGMACNMKEDIYLRRKYFIGIQLAWGGGLVIVICVFGPHIGFLSCMPIILPNVADIIYEIRKRQNKVEKK